MTQNDQPLVGGHRAQILQFKPRRPQDPDRERLDRITENALIQGRHVADLFEQTAGPLRYSAPDLKDHIKGAFVRWLFENMRTMFEDQVEIGTAVAAGIQAFGDRVIEIEWGFDPNGGDAA